MGRRGIQIVIALVIALVSIIGYFTKSSFNPVTGETQRVSLSMDQEVALGLQAVPQMAEMHGGMSADRAASAQVAGVGQRLVAATAEAVGDQFPDYPFEFHLLEDDETVNAFALPGGQIFITEALYSRLETEGQLAGVLGHEIGHVLARHGAEHMAKAELTQGLTGAAVMATYDPNSPGSSRQSAAMAQMIGNMVNMKYGRDDELESDNLGVRFMGAAGYDPRAMIRVMEILAEASGGGGRQPEFFSTHPNPENRIQRIQQAIERAFPEGLPEGLEP